MIKVNGTHLFIRPSESLMQYDEYFNFRWLRTPSLTIFPLVRYLLCFNSKRFVIKQRRMERLELSTEFAWWPQKRFIWKNYYFVIDFCLFNCLQTLIYRTPGCRKILMSYSSSEPPRKPSTLVPTSEEPICIVVGAIAKGAIETDYTEENISISNYPLSAALTCSKLCDAFEEAWGVF